MSSKTQKQHFLDVFDKFVEGILDQLDEEEGNFKLEGSKVIARTDYTLSTLYNYGGYEMMAANRPFVDYKKKNGTLHIDIAEAREHYDV